MVDDREYLCGLLKEESDRRQAADKALLDRLDVLEKRLIGTKGLVLLVIAALSSAGPQLLALIKALSG